jgi:hypothetical protein
LVYAWKGNLLAAPFSLTEMAVTGPAVTMIEGVANRRWASLQAVLSDTGTLAWVPAPSGNRQLFWVDRAGKESPLELPPSPYDLLALSPKGDRILIERRENSHLKSIWDYDMGSLRWTRVASGEWENTAGVWSPDQSEIAISAVLRGEQYENLYVTAVDSPAPERVSPSPGFQFPQCWSAHAGLIYTGTESTTLYNQQVLELTVEPGRKPVSLVGGKVNSTAGSASPDGRWLAYASDITGRDEVFVRPLIAAGAPLQITSGGGRAPLWSPAGGELFYRVGDTMWSVAMRDGKPSAARKLFSGSYTPASAWNRRYSVTRDGQRFLMMRDIADTEDFRRIHVVENWSVELARMVPSRR